MEFALDNLSRTVTGAKTLEDLARPMLEMLEAVTGLETTYVTTIDLDRGEQNIVFSHNAGTLQIAEGLTVPWADTLCKRAMDDGQFCTSDVPHRWADSETAAELGIQTYVSMPIETETGGAVWNPVRRKLGPAAPQPAVADGAAALRHHDRPPGGA